MFSLEAWQAIGVITGAMLAVGTAIVGVARLLRWCRRQLCEWWVVKGLVNVYWQLQPNGGASLVDKVTQSVAKLEVIEAVQFQLLNHSPDAYYICDQQGECTYANAALCAMFGLARENMLGRGWLTAISEDERLEVWQEWQRCVQAEIPYSNTYTIYHCASGARSRVRTTAEYCRGVDGGFSMHVGVVKRVDDEPGTGGRAAAD